jgi:hypothetical protein
MMQLLRMPLSPSQAKKGSATEPHRGLVITILGVVVLFQTIHHTLITSKLESEDGLSVACEDGSTAGSDQQCAEHQLFRTWQAAVTPAMEGILPESEDLDKLLIRGTDGSAIEGNEDDDDEEEVINEVLNASTIPMPAKELAPPLEHAVVTTTEGTAVRKDSAATAAPVVAGSSTGGPSIIVAHAGEVQRWGNLTPWAQSLVDLQARMEAQMRNRRSARRQRGHLLAERKETTPLDEIMEVGREMCLQPHRHDYAACVQFLGKNSTPQQQRAALGKHYQALQEERTAWEEAFSQRLNAFGRELCSEPQRKDYPSCVRFLATGNASHPASAIPSSRAQHQPQGDLTPWAQGLLELQATMEAQMKNLHSAHKMHQHGAVISTPPPSGAATTRPPKPEKSTLEEIMTTGREMCLQPHRRNYSSCAYFLNNEPTPEHLFDERFKALETNHKAWERNFTENVMSFGQELCRDPKRSGYASCLQFLSGKNTRSGDASDGHRVPEGNLSESIMAFGRELCSEPHRKDYASCAKFRQPAEHALRKEALPTIFPGEIHWRKVTAWQSETPAKQQHLRGASSGLVYDAGELRQTQWSGMIPKVACITVVPCGKMAKIWMKHFINNFRMQKYEGPRELVLVYHYQDTETAHLVAQYANGISIKAVAAMSEDYPSTAAFRFGAWKSDAEVIARWDFDAWHNPKQLSMQVRALALSGRPACVLKRWSVRGRAGGALDHRTAEGGDDRADAALVGEAVWMRQHWYPLLDGLNIAASTARAHHVVQVDMPTLNIYDEDLYDLAPAKDSQCRPSSKNQV